LVSSKNRNIEGKEDVAMVMRNIKACKIKLENIRQKHNEAIAQNRQLRENINALRKEKEIFRAILEQSQQDLKEKKDNVLGIITNSNEEKKKMNKTSQHLLETKSMAFRERKEFEKEFRSIFKTFDVENRDEKLKEVKNRKDRDSSEEINDKTGLKPSHMVLL
jgi:coiled-coil domain-containing protein 63/114